MAGSAAGEGGASMVEIAVWNHFGTEKETADGGKKPHIPARPFITMAIDENGRAWKKTVARVLRLLQAGTITQETAEGILGADMQADIQQALVALRDPANADSTIEQKGSDNPLIDTGALKDAVKWAKNA